MLCCVARAFDWLFLACLQTFDTDGDGVITFKEMAAGMADMGATEEQLKPFFDKFDADENGELTLAEFTPLAEMILGVHTKSG